MLKNISRFAEKLSKTEQRNIIVKGGRIPYCPFSNDPSTDWCCDLPRGCPSDF